MFVKKYMDITTLKFIDFVDDLRAAAKSDEEYFFEWIEKNVKKYKLVKQTEYTERGNSVKFTEGHIVFNINDPLAEALYDRRYSIITLIDYRGKELDVEDVDCRLCNELDYWLEDQAVFYY